MDGAVDEDFLATFDAFIAGRRALLDVLALEQSWFNWRISSLRPGHGGGGPREIPSNGSTVHGCEHSS
jgi:hypothetical protein